MQAPQPRPDGMRALLPMGAGPLLTGSTDTAIRLWNGARPEASYVVCGPPALPAEGAAAGGGPGAGAKAGAAMPVAYTYAGRQMAGVPVVEETTIAHNSEPQARRCSRALRQFEAALRSRDVDR